MPAPTHELMQSLLQFVTALGELLVALGAIALPFLPLVVWIAFWMFAVNWLKLRVVLLQGGWIGLLLLGLLAVLVWGTGAPPDSGVHHFLGLTLSNYVGKTVLVTTLVCIMLLCGSVQLSGACGNLCQFDEPEPSADFHAAQHGPGDSHVGQATAGHH